MSVVDKEFVVRSGAGKSVGAVDTNDRFVGGWCGEYGGSFRVLCESDGP